VIAVTPLLALLRLWCLRQYIGHGAGVVCMCERIVGIRTNESIGIFESKPEAFVIRGLLVSLSHNEPAVRNRQERGGVGPEMDFRNQTGAIPDIS
jgi:hypothetical protein